MKPVVTVTVNAGKQKDVVKSLSALTKKQVLVGIPEANAMARQADLLKLLSTARGKKKQARLQAAAKQMINNAALLYIFTNGSPIKHIPARPVIEPAIEDEQNSALICELLEKAAGAALDGKPEQVERYLKLAGQLAENLVRAWFVNPRNGWAPNAPSTIRRKGSSKPGIDFGEMRKSITSQVVEAE
jgi:hypothetical protein